MLTVLGTLSKMDVVLSQDQGIVFVDAPLLCFRGGFLHVVEYGGGCL